MRSYATCNSQIVMLHELTMFYRTTFVQHASETDYVIHSILAFSALHQAYLQRQVKSRVQEEKYTNATHMHFDKATKSFREATNKVTEENCTGVFASSCLMSLLSFAIYHPEQERCQKKSIDGKRSPLTERLPWLSVVRGISYFVLPFYRTVAAGPSAPMVRRFIDGPPPELAPGIAERFDRLASALAAIPDLVVSRVCSRALSRLVSTPAS